MKKPIKAPPGHHWVIEENFGPGNHPYKLMLVKNKGTAYPVIDKTFRFGPRHVSRKIVREFYSNKKIKKAGN